MCLLRMPTLPYAERFRGVHIFLPLDGQGLAADDTRHVQPLGEADGDEDQNEIPAEKHHKQDDEEDERQGVQDVDDAHHHFVDAPAEITRHGAVCHAERQRHEGGQNTDSQRYPYADQNAREQIATVSVRAKQEADANNVGNHRGALAVGRQRFDPAIVEQIRTVDVAHDAGIDCLFGGDRRGDGRAADTDLAHRHARPLQNALKLRNNRLGLRVGFEARRHTDILRIDAVVGVRDNHRSDCRGKRQQTEHDGARDRSAVTPQPAPGVLPKRAADDRMQRFAIRLRPSEPWPPP